MDQATAQNQGLIGVQNGAVFMRADSDNVATGRGRNSIRISSNDYWADVRENIYGRHFAMLLLISHREYIFWTSIICQ